MSNYADWKITQMLPNNNPYNTQVFWNYYAGNYSLSHTKWNTYVRDGWTWEDIRLYLESEGYYLCRNMNTEDINKGLVNVWKNEKEYKSFLEDSYEEARREAIKHCLKLINV